MITVVVFTITEKLKPKYSSTGEWINKMRYTAIQWNTVQQHKGKKY